MACPGGGLVVGRGSLRRPNEGAEVSDRRVLVVEDVVTSAGQIVISAGKLRDLGARVDTALCVIDRQEGGAEALAREGIGLRALFTRESLELDASARVEL